MKYISTFIFAVVLIVSWRLIHEQATINFETHASIQLKMVDIIKQSILEIKPLAEKIEVTNISTEPLSDQALKAYFSYKYNEPDTESGEMVEQQISGEAILRRKNGPNFSEDHWVMENVQTQTGNMTFKNGIIITPGSNDSKTETPNLETPLQPKSNTTESDTTNINQQDSTPAEKKQSAPTSPTHSTHPESTHE